MTILAERSRLFLRWWARELRALLPPPLMRLARRPDRPTVVLSGLADVPNLAPTGEIDVLLDPALVLSKTLQLPTAAAGSLRALLRNEIGRQTPYPPERALFDWTVAPAGAAQGLSVTLFVANRDRILQRLDSLGPGTSVRRVGVLHQPEQLDLLRNEPAKPLGYGQQVRRMLPLATMGLLTALIAAAADRAERQTEQLAGVVADARKKAAVAARLKSEISRIEQASQELSARKRRVPASRLLDDVAAVLPDDTWIEHLQLTASGLRVEGRSADAARLPGLMEASPLLRRATFAAPLTRSATDGLEHFTITAELEPEGQP